MKSREFIAQVRSWMEETRCINGEMSAATLSESAARHFGLDLDDNVPNWVYFLAAHIKKSC